jgi:hypothetical protein
MSRSIHTTQRELREARLRAYRDDKLEAAEVAEVEKELARKRSIKEAVSGNRRTEETESVGALGGPIPVRIADQAAHIMHPATPEDIEAVRRRLPVGVMDGLSEIVLKLGQHEQLEGEDASVWDPDPITNRRGLEILPGFYKGWIWGTYESLACRINLHAFVADPATTSPMPTTAYFKLHILSTFVHEVAHHFDYTRRVARGRWLADEKEKVEHFADHRQHEWTQTCVVPYLEEAYPQEVAELLHWLEVHGRTRFALGELIDDPRQVCFFSIEHAVEELVKGVLQETQPIEMLLNFAIDLKIADRYERAHEVIDHILAEVPGHGDALGLRASILNLQGDFVQSIQLALQVLDCNPRNWRARTTLTRAYEGLNQWEKAIETATESLTLCDEDHDRFDAFASRSMAYWRLGMREESDQDLRTLQSSEFAGRRVEWILRERGIAKQ